MNTISLQTEQHPGDRASRAERIVTLTLAALCPVLAAHDVTSVTIDYDGYGDEGQVNEITLCAADNAIAEMPDARCRSHWLTHQGQIEAEDTDLETALDRFATEALESVHGGWENNEGAFGTLVIDVARRSVVLEHSTRVLSCETDTHEWGGG